MQRVSCEVHTDWAKTQSKILPPIILVGRDIGFAVNANYTGLCKESLDVRMHTRRSRPGMRTNLQRYTLGRIGPRSASGSCPIASSALRVSHLGGSAVIRQEFLFLSNRVNNPSACVSTLGDKNHDSIGAKCSAITKRCRYPGTGCYFRFISWAELDLLLYNVKEYDHRTLPTYASSAGKRFVPFLHFSLDSPTA